MRILLAEDNRPLADGLATLLRGSGYAVDVVHDGTSADALTASGEGFELVILDLNLPGLDGLEVLRAMRGRRHPAAVLILTARGTPEDRIRGLDGGADDYLIKPFDTGEFEARVRSLLRRQAGLRASTVTFGSVTLDLNARSFAAGGVTLDLPARELALLTALFLRAGKVVAKEALIQSLTSLDEDISANAIEQYVSRLRKRLSPHGLTLRTARGIGYYIDHAE